eukprot:scaffold24406_cov17-Tisochrysis_lutea.AAC.4
MSVLAMAADTSLRCSVRRLFSSACLHAFKVSSKMNISHACKFAAAWGCWAQQCHCAIHGACGFDTYALGLALVCTGVVGLAFVWGACGFDICSSDMCAGLVDSAVLQWQCMGLVGFVGLAVTMAEYAGLEGWHRYIGLCTRASHLTPVCGAGGLGSAVVRAGL